MTSTHLLVGGILLACVILFRVGEILKSRVPPAEVPIPPEPGPEPWRTHLRVAEIGLMPVSVLLMLMPAWRLTSIERLDEDRCAALADSIARNGLYQPVTVKVDQRGGCTLHDGNHRTVVCWRMGWTELPVLVESATHLKTFSLPASEVIGLLAQAKKEDQV